MFLFLFYVDYTHCSNFKNQLIFLSQNVLYSIWKIYLNLPWEIVGVDFVFTGYRWRDLARYFGCLPRLPRFQFSFVNEGFTHGLPLRRRRICFFGLLRSASRAFVRCLWRLMNSIRFTRLPDEPRPRWTFLIHLKYIKIG